MDVTETDETPDPDDFTDARSCPDKDAALAEICKTLQKRHVKHAIIRYQGCGDSGCVEDVEFVPAPSTLPDSVKDRLCEVAEDYSPVGYENNEGGWGTLTVYPLLGLATLEHFDRFEDSESMGVNDVALPAKLRKKLLKLGVNSITVPFDGCGDSGQLEEFVVQPETATLDKRVADALETFLNGQLPMGLLIAAKKRATFAACEGASSSCPPIQICNRLVGPGLSFNWPRSRAPRIRLAVLVSRWRTEAGRFLLIAVIPDRAARRGPHGRRRRSAGSHRHLPDPVPCTCGLLRVRCPDQSRCGA